MTYTQGKAAIAALESNGWTHIITIMSDQGARAARGEYGMLFTKDREQFWLNKDTYSPCTVTR